jgi:hypothetical protein
LDALYEAGFTTNAPAAAQNNAFSVLWNTGAEPIYLWEIGQCSDSGGTLPKFALTRISARGTQTATTAGTPWNPSEPAAAGTVDSAWSVQPTVSGTYRRRAHQLGQQSSGLFWLWWATEKGLVVPPSAGVGIVLATAAAAGPAQSTYYIWSE